MAKAFLFIANWWAFAAAASLSACAGGTGNSGSIAAPGGNNAASAVPAPPSAPAQTALTIAQLAGSRWQTVFPGCEAYRTIEFRADSIVTPSRTIRVAYENRPGTENVLEALPEGAPAMARYRFDMSDAGLRMFNPDTGLPCVFTRAS